MNTLSKKEKREIPFSRRYTLREIWVYLDKKYPEDTENTHEEYVTKRV